MKIIEYNKKDRSLFTVWNDKRIKEAFNFGKGSKKDMLNYIKNNKQYADFEIIKNED